MPLHHLLNLALLVAYPIAWWSPLARAGFLPWFTGDTISVIRGVQDLWKVDPALAFLVALFAMIMPMAKTLMLAAIHRGWKGPMGLITVIGKLSMTDVFLIAVYIVVVKGVGVGHVTTAWGLWFFTACVLASMWVAWRTSTEA